jgi:Protein of unknown function (DUF2934)
MRPDSESQPTIYFSPNPSASNVGNHTLKNPVLRQKLKAGVSDTLKQQTNTVSRQNWISDAAYCKAEARGFIPGYEVSDWLDAEREYKAVRVDLFLSECREDGDMTITGLRRLAKDIGVPRPERIDSTIKLIRLIQAANDQQPCFKTKPGELCKDHEGCQWSSECQKLVAEWTRCCQ